MTEQRDINSLSIHPFNRDVYHQTGDPDTGLAENINKFGLQKPIKVTPDGEILSGARRWAACKDLGWTEIPSEVPDVDFNDENAVQLYVLIANAYRKQKTSYQQKREADEYRRLYDEGSLTKDDLRERARERSGVDDSRRHNEETQRQYDSRNALAARAAGMSPTTYNAYTYFTDGRADDEIEEALSEREIEPDQAQSLKQEKKEIESKVKADEEPPETARRDFRSDLKEAKRESSMSEEERRREEAQEAVDDVRKKGRAYVSALERLFMKHRDHLDGEMGMVVATTFNEVQGLLQEQLPAGFLGNGSKSAGDTEEAVEADYEIVE